MQGRRWRVEQARPIIPSEQGPGDLGGRRALGRYRDGDKDKDKDQLCGAYRPGV